MYKYTFAGANSSETIQKFDGCNIDCVISFEGCFKDNPNTAPLPVTLTWVKT